MQAFHFLFILVFFNIPYIGAFLFFHFQFYFYFHSHRASFIYSTLRAKLVYPFMQPPDAFNRSSQSTFTPVYIA